MKNWLLIFLLSGIVSCVSRNDTNDKGFETAFLNPGILWTWPFTMDITNALVPGEKRLIIEVTNSWNNRLVLDKRLPLENRVGYLSYYDELKQIGMERINQYLELSTDDNLHKSGLTGPCRILVRKQIRAL